MQTWLPPPIRLKNEDAAKERRRNVPRVQETDYRSRLEELLRGQVAQRHDLARSRQDDIVPPSAVSADLAVGDHVKPVRDSQLATQKTSAQENDQGREARRVRLLLEDRGYGTRRRFRPRF